MTQEEYDEQPDLIPAEYLCDRCHRREGELMDEQGNLICEECG